MPPDHPKPTPGASFVPIAGLDDGRRVLSIRPLDFPKGEVFHLHRHTCGQLIYAISGMLVVRSSVGSWIVPSQRGVWVPPLLEHSVNMLTDTQMRSVYLNIDLSLRVKGPCRVISIPHVLRELVLFAASRMAGDEPELDNAIGTLIAQIINESIASPLAVPIPNDPRLFEIYCRLSENPSAPETIEAWGKHIGVTERTFVRHLKKETGMTFRIWRQQIRLLSSLERLAKGEPVTTVALDVGYNTPSGFITAFRRSFGTTPSSYFKTNPS
jgi:AraC-like DNA-binding protein/quercetin dioxygenase-like cupin family protein